MRVLGEFVLIVLLILVVLVIGTAVVLGWGVGLGWLVTRILPLTLFEASLLVMLATLAVSYLLWSVLREMPVVDGIPGYESTEKEDRADYPVPYNLFFRTGSEKTVADWFRFEITNEIYLHLVDETNVEETMNKPQLEQLAIRLTDVVVAVLRARRTRSRKISVTKKQLVRQLVKMGQQPYDDDLLLAALTAVNDRLSYDDKMVDVVYERSWDETLQW